MDAARGYREIYETLKQRIEEKNKTAESKEANKKEVEELSGAKFKAF